MNDSVRHLGPPMPIKGNGSFSKGGNKNPTGRAPWADPGGEVYQDSDWGLKTNERSLSKNMHLLSEFTCYLDWEAASKKMGRDFI